MIPEFDVESAIMEAEVLSGVKKDEENRSVAVTLSSQQVLPLATFLSEVAAVRDFARSTLHLEPDVIRRFEEDIVAIFDKKLNEALGEQSEPRVYFDVNRRELDKLGEFLLLDRSEKKRFRKYGDIKGPARSSFLVIQDEFVRSGGIGNIELRNKILAKSN